jgi:hypothetical protein
MRPILVGAGLALALLALLVGCNTFKPHSEGTSDRILPGTAAAPTAEKLVAYLNQNAQAVRSIEAKKVFMTARQNNEHVGGLEGFLACQKGDRPGVPPNFRLQAEVVGSSEVDIGSNSEEFWFWIKRAPQPYVFHCSYADYPKVAARGNMPFPFQPEWVVEALGMAEYDPSQKYEINTQGQSKTYDLVQRTQSAKGAPVVKVVAFHKAPRPGTSQVAAYILYEPTNDNKTPYRQICSAIIDESQVVPVGGGKSVAMPSKVRLICPQEKMELTMELGKVQVNVPFDPDRVSMLFTRQSLSGLKSYDLARGPDEPAGGVRPAGGVMR